MFEFFSNVNSYMHCHVKQVVWSILSFLNQNKEYPIETHNFDLQVILDVSYAI